MSEYEKEIEEKLRAVYPETGEVMDIPVVFPPDLTARKDALQEGMTEEQLDKEEEAFALGMVDLFIETQQRFVAKVAELLDGMEARKNG